jgi:hypothetical protein
MEFNAMDCLMIQIAAAAADAQGTGCGCGGGNVPPVDNTCGTNQIQVDYSLGLNVASTTTYEITGSGAFTPRSTLPAQDFQTDRVCIPAPNAGDTYTYSWTSVRTNVAAGRPE